MNDVFNFRRFCSYAAKQYLDNWKRYVISAAAVIGTLLFVVTMVKLSGGNTLSFPTGYLALLIVFGVVFTMNDMKFLRNRHASSIDNTLPVSITERFVFILLNTTVGLFIVFALGLLIAALFSAYIYKMGTFGQFFTNMKDVWKVLYFGFFTTHALVLYAGTMQRKSHVLSIVLAGLTIFAGMAAMVGVPAFLSEWIGGDLFIAPMFSGIRNSVREGSVTLAFNTWAFPEPSGTDMVNVMAVIAAASILILWVGAWFNLRERNIK